jgi:hypothetical protein
MLTGELKTLFEGELITHSELTKMYDKIAINSWMQILKQSEKITIPKNGVYFSFGVRKQITSH